MIQVGKLNSLQVEKILEHGVMLGSEGDSVLLPIRYVRSDVRTGDILDVFVYLDSEDRPVATTEKPHALLGEFALLTVKSIEKVGVFLDWGLQKDLLLPYREQSRDLRVGERVVVYIYLDSSSRIAASMRLERQASKAPPPFTQGQQVNLMIIGRSDLGYKAIVNGTHVGMLYANEVFQKLNYGDRVAGFVKTLRPDNKIDLMLQPTGHHAAADIGEKILQELRKHDGFLKLTDKTEPQEIYKLFGVSKKKYKIALGGLYKKRLIRIEPEGIRLLGK